MSKRDKRKLFRRKTLSRPASSIYQIVETSGVRDGALLRPGEKFTRSWTILNTNQNLIKEKGKIAKLVLVSGEPLKEQLFFLWPTPGKTVKITLDLVAPNVAGWYESFWKIHGQDEVDFSLRFEVSEGLGNASEFDDMYEVQVPVVPEEKNFPTFNKRRRRTTSESKPHRESGTFNEILFNSFDSLPFIVDGKIVNVEESEQVDVNKNTSNNNNINNNSSNNNNDNDNNNNNNNNNNNDDEETEHSVKKRRKSINSSKRGKTKKRRSRSEKEKSTTEDTSIHCVQDNIIPIPNIHNDNTPTSSKPLTTLTLEDHAQASSLDNKIASDLNDEIENTKFKYYKMTPGRDTDKRDYLRPQDDRKNSRELISRWQANVMEEKNKRMMEEHQVKSSNSRIRAISMKNLLSQKTKKLAEKSGASPSFFATPKTSMTKRRIQRRISGNLRVQIVDPSDIQQMQHNISKMILYSCQLEQRVTQQFSQDYGSYVNLMPITMQCNQRLQEMNAYLQSISEEMQTVVDKIHEDSKTADLPHFLWLRIFKLLDLNSLRNVSLVSRKWNLLFKHDALWEARYHKLMKGQEEVRTVLTEPFRYQSLYKIEQQYSTWFSKEEWTLNANHLFTNEAQWPINDLICENRSLIAVSDCIRTYDIRKKKPKGCIPGHEKPVYCVAVTENGEHCVTGSVDTSVKVWSLRENECEATLLGHCGTVSSLQVNRNTIISNCKQDKGPIIWNLTTGKRQYQCNIDPKDGICCVALNLTRPSPSHVYFGKSSGVVSLWDIEAAREVQSYQIATGMIEGLQVFGDLICASDYSRMYLKPFQLDRSAGILSPQMMRTVGKIRYNGNCIGVQLDSRLELFDLRYLYSVSSFIQVDNLWRGAFVFDGDSIIIGSGNGQIYHWAP